MKLIFIAVLVGLLGICSMAQSYECLPSDVREDDVVDFKTVSLPNGVERRDKVTVKQTLKKIGARCVAGKLVDDKGKQIRFYFLQGCWGNPPADYQEILDRQSKEIERLKKNCTVIEMTCNPSGLPRQSIL